MPKKPEQVVIPRNNVYITELNKELQIMEENKNEQKVIQDCELNEELKILSIDELEEGEEYFIQFYEKYNWYDNSYIKKYSTIYKFINIHKAYIGHLTFKINHYRFINKDNYMFDLTFLNKLTENFATSFKMYRPIENKLICNLDSVSINVAENYSIISMRCNVYRLPNITNEYVLK